MQNMVSASSQLQASKQKLVNHSTKKHLVQKLVDNNIPLTEIAQITGHKNVNSFNNYSTVSDKKQQHISTILSGASSSNENVTLQITIDEVCTAKSIQPCSHNFPVFNNCQIGTVNVLMPTQTGGEFSVTKKQRVIISSDSEGSQ